MDRLKKLIEYISGPIIQNGHAAILPAGEPFGLLSMYIEQYAKKWILWGAFGMVFGYLFTVMLDNEYFIEAAMQMLASYLWNMVVVLGLFFSLFGALFHALYLKSFSDYCFRSSFDILKFASEIGALGFGALIGLFLVVLVESGMDDFMDYIRSAIGIWALGFFCMLNLVVWWVVYCLSDDVPIPEYFVYIGERKLLLATMCVLCILLLGVVTAITEPDKLDNEKQQNCITTSQ